MKNTKIWGWSAYPRIPENHTKKSNPKINPVFNTNTFKPTHNPILFSTTHSSPTSKSLKNFQSVQTGSTPSNGKYTFRNPENIRKSVLQKPTFSDFQIYEPTYKQGQIYEQAYTQLPINQPAKSGTIITTASFTEPAVTMSYNTEQFGNLLFYTEPANSNPRPSIQLQ